LVKKFPYFEHEVVIKLMMTDEEIIELGVLHCGVESLATRGMLAGIPL